MTFKKALRASFIMHVIFLLLISGVFPKGCGSGGDGNGNGGNSESEKKGESPEEQDNKSIEDILPQETEVELIEKTPEMEEAFAQMERREFQKELAKCQDYFGGIGVTHDGKGAIEKAHKFYPAYDAGIRDGDILIGSVMRLRGPIGTPVTVNVIRNGTHLTFNLIRGKICTKDVTP